MKFVLFTALCIILFVESQSSKEESSSRGLRQMLEFEEIASQIPSLMAEATRNAIEIGKSTMQNMAQNPFGSINRIPATGQT